MADAASPVQVLACSTALGRLRAPVAAGDIRPRRLLCAGRVSVGMVIEAIEAGCDRVIVVACDEASCRHRNGARLAAGQVDIARRLLATLGLGADAVTLVLVGRDGCPGAAVKEQP